MEFTTSKPGRLDTLLAAEDEALSRSKIQSAIKQGLVTVNGTVVKKASQKLSSGDCVIIDEAAAHITHNAAPITPIDLHLEVLFEDDAVMVINKPAGIAVHPGHSMDQDEQTILHGIAHLFADRNIPFSADSTLAHRLDKPTTGCLAVVKNNNSFQHLQKQFENRTTKKTYIAIVSGVPEHQSATIDAPIGRSLTDRTKMSILKTSVSRDAKTTYTVLDSTDACSLLECDLHTGRTHQLRVHLASIGHPILGDSAYGSPASIKQSESYGIEGLCLHAQSLRFVSPADNNEHLIEAPLPDAFVTAQSAVGLTA